jgi:hypothetical protein
VSVTPRDHVALAHIADPLQPFAHALREVGLKARVRPAWQADVDQAGSSWARRLGIPERRPAWLLVARAHGL